MAIRFVDLETAKATEGLRIVLIKGVPSPWSQAAKAIVEIKGMEATGVWMPAADADITAWTGVPNGPAVLYQGEPVRSGWAEILALCERLAPQPPLVPADLEQRVRVFGYAHELLGQGGLIWNARLMAIEASITGQAAESYPAAVGQYLGTRYGYTPGCGTSARKRAEEILAGLAVQLERGKAAGGPYYMGASLTALDIYSATVLDGIVPLPQEQCSISPKIRAGLAWPGEQLGDAIAPTLLAHRDMMHERHMPLPMDIG